MAVRKIRLTGVNFMGHQDGSVLAVPKQIKKAEADYLVKSGCAEETIESELPEKDKKTIKKDGE